MGKRRRSTSCVDKEDKYIHMCGKRQIKCIKGSNGLDGIWIVNKGIGFFAKDTI